MDTITTTCRYLFGKSASEIFDNKTFPEQFVEKSLLTLTKVCDLLMKKPEAYFLFASPTVFNDQCHLYSMMTTQKSDKRFFYLSFLLSYGILTDATLLEKVVVKNAEEPLPEPKKKFSTFLKDPNGAIRKAARAALLLFFEEHIKNNFALKENDPLYKELTCIANNDLMLPASRGEGKVYTLPKLAGVIFLIDEMAREKLTLMFKVTVMTKMGKGSFSYCSKKKNEVAENSPVIVFEMIVSDCFTFLECREKARKCNSHSMRYQSSKERHKTDESCDFCTLNTIDVTPFKEKYLPILEKGDELLYALAVDFVREHQKPFLKFFQNEKEFPKLTQLFNTSEPKIEEFCLSRTTLGNISVSHVHTDCALYAFKEELMICGTYAEHLKERGLI